MSVRVRYKVTTYVSSTTAEEKDLANQQWEVMTDTQGEGGSWKSTLQPGDGEPHTVTSGSGIAGDTISGTAPYMTLTIAAASFSSSMVGMSVTIAGATTGTNNGTFLITSVGSSTQITYVNASGVAEGFTGTYSVYSSDPVRLELGNLSTAKLLIVRTNAKDPTLTLGSITLRKNSTTGEDIVVQPLGDAKEGHLVLSTDSIASLYAINPSGGVATEVTVIAAGD